MRWPGWMRQRNEEVFLREAGKFVSERYEVQLLERFVNGEVSWIVEVRRDGEEQLVRRHELTDDELRGGLGLLTTLHGILNNSLITTPIADIRERARLGD